MAPQALAAPSALSEHTNPAALLPIGTAIAGGFYAGLIRDADQVFALIMSPQAGALKGAWHASRTDVPGAESYVNGHANTVAMAEAGSELAATALSIIINDFADWYIPARDELELLYRHFKPTDYENFACEDGANEHSIPAGEEYTEQTPAQTQLVAFQEGSADALPARWHWSSTQYAPFPYGAWGQSFNGGGQVYYHKSAEGRARAVRRLPIQSFINSIAEAAQLEAAEQASEIAAAA